MGTFIILIICSGSCYSLCEQADILHLTGEKQCFKYCFKYCLIFLAVIKFFKKCIYGILACVVPFLSLLLLLRQFSAYKREKLTTKERYLFSSFADQVPWEHLAFEDDYPL